MQLFLKYYNILIFSEMQLQYEVPPFSNKLVITVTSLKIQGNTVCTED